MWAKRGEVGKSLLHESRGIDAPADRCDRMIDVFYSETGRGGRHRPSVKLSLR